MYLFAYARQRVGRMFFFVSAFLVFSASNAGTPLAQAVTKADDPWHAVAVADTDHDHAHLATKPSPFDAMSNFELAAVPNGHRIHYNAPSKCIPGQLKSVLERVAAKYGPITVNSTYRSKKRNRSAGGKRNSYHLTCEAIDFRVHGSTSGLVTYLRHQKSVGGYKRYPSGFLHIDAGPRRTW